MVWGKERRLCETEKIYWKRHPWEAFSKLAAQQSAKWIITQRQGHRGCGIRRKNGDIKRIVHSKPLSHPHCCIFLIPISDLIALKIFSDNSHTLNTWEYTSWWSSVCVLHIAWSWLHLLATLWMSDAHNVLSSTALPSSYRPIWLLPSHLWSSSFSAAFCFSQHDDCLFQRMLLSHDVP